MSFDESMAEFVETEEDYFSQYSDRITPEEQRRMEYLRQELDRKEAEEKANTLQVWIPGVGTQEVQAERGFEAVSKLFPSWNIPWKGDQTYKDSLLADFNLLVAKPGELQSKQVSVSIFIREL